MVETPKFITFINIDIKADFVNYIECYQWQIGCEVLKRDVSTDYTGGPFKLYRVKK